MLGEAEAISLSGMVTVVTAAVACLLSVCGIVYTAGRLRGRLDSHQHRIEVVEKKNAQLTHDIYERLGSLDRCFTRVVEQFKACQVLHGVSPGRSVNVGEQTGR